MTQFSMLPWETQTGTGDGANSYTQDQANNFFRYFDVRDPASEGVAYGVLNALAVSGTASPLSVASGAAVCYGRYWNDAAVTLAVTTPVVGTTGGRVVLRADWSANTIRLFVKMSTDGNAAIPALVQTAGTTWEISLATFTITTGGVITVTDDRTFRKVTGKLDSGDIDDVDMFANALITGAKIASETIVPGNIVNRTRKFLVPAVLAYNNTDGINVDATNNLFHGIDMVDAKSISAMGRFHVPEDFVSGMTVKPVFEPAASSGNLSYDVAAGYGAVGQAFNAHTDTSGAQVTAIISGLLNTPYTLTLANVAIGDVVSLVATRQGADVSDTVNATVFFAGFIVQYTADI